MRILSILFLLISSLLISATFSGASYAACDINSTKSASDFLKGCATDNAISASEGGDGVTSIKQLVMKVSGRVIAFGALFAVGAIVFSGIQYTTSYGDDEKVKKAKTTGIYAIIGLFLLLLAFPLVNMTINFVYGL